MDAIISQVKDLARTADHAGRTKIQDSLRELQRSLESPFELVQNIMESSFPICLTRLAIQLNLFKTLAENGAPMTVDRLAEKSGASTELLGRILRYLASVDSIDQTKANEFAANDRTKILAEPSCEKSLCAGFELFLPMAQAFPDFFKSNAYQAVTGAEIFQTAFKTDVSPYEYLGANPERLSNFQSFMTLQRWGDWTTKFPVRERIKDSGVGSDHIVFVDIGGGTGHQCVRLVDKFPDFRGRVVLQDRPEVIKQVPDLDGIKVTSHDFHEPQPVKGANFYYLRQVLHNYPDEICQNVILKNLRSALAPYSRILIDEAVVPQTGAHWEEATLDLLMMTIGSKERTLDQWEKLVDVAGFKIEKIWRYSWPISSSIIELVPKS